MIRLSNKAILILCIIVLDFLLIADVYKNNKPQVLGINTKIVKKVKATPTPTPTPTPKKLNIKPYIYIPKSSPTPTPTKAEVKETVSQTGDLLVQINSFRSSKGLSPLSANSETCFFANMRVQEIQSAFNHDGFTNRINSKSLPYTSYSEVAENIAMNSNPNEVISGWINSPGHNANMLKNVPFGCVVGSGNYYVFEAWRP